jgi:excisionase family DNA binding protein
MTDDNGQGALGSAMGMPAATTPARDRLLTPGEVATLFRVDPKTVTRWASAGRIGSIRTPGGHRRFRESEVRALLRGADVPTAAPSAAAPMPSLPAQTTPANAPMSGRPLTH